MSDPEKTTVILHKKLPTPEAPGLRTSLEIVAPGLERATAYGAYIYDDGIPYWDCLAEFESERESFVAEVLILNWDGEMEIRPVLPYKIPGWASDEINENGAEFIFEGCSDNRAVKDYAIRYFCRAERWLLSGLHPGDRLTFRVFLPYWSTTIDGESDVSFHSRLLKIVKHGSLRRRGLRAAKVALKHHQVLKAREKKARWVKRWSLRPENLRHCRLKECQFQHGFSAAEITLRAPKSLPKNMFFIQTIAQAYNCRTREAALDALFEAVLKINPILTRELFDSIKRA